MTTNKKQNEIEMAYAQRDAIKQKQEEKMWAIHEKKKR